LTDAVAAIAREEVLGVDEVDLVLRRDSEHVRVGWVPLDTLVGVALDGRHGHKQQRGDVVVHQLRHLPDDEPSVGRYTSESVARRDEVDDRRIGRERLGQLEQRPCTVVTRDEPHAPAGHGVCDPVGDADGAPGYIYRLELQQRDGCQVQTVWRGYMGRERLGDINSKELGWGALLRACCFLPSPFFGPLAFFGTGEARWGGAGLDWRVRGGECCGTEWELFEPEEVIRLDGELGKGGQGS
jgi:hypothetical protein